MRWLLALLVVGGALDFDARLKPLIPDDTWTPHGQVMAPPVTLAEHAAALRADPDHGNAFFVRAVAGEPASTRVVFVIPQFHRSPLLPITWSSLGAAIEGVQANIDFTLTRLVRAHGVRCVGTEGTWLEKMNRSTELDQVAAWLADLRRHRESASALLPDVAAEMETAEKLLTPYLRRHAMMLDGAGIALARIAMAKDVPGVVRFGLEDEKLNTRSLELLRQIRPIEEELALLEPSVEDEAEDGLAAIWRDEWPAFKNDVAIPLQEALGTLQKRRLALMKEGDEDLAHELGKFTALAGSLVEEVLRLEGAYGYEQYYEELRTKKAAPEAKKIPDAKQKRRIRALRQKLGPLQEAYERIANQDRERAAVRRTLSRMGEGPVGRCAVVMGANHADGLVAAVKKQGGGRVGVIVVAPYPEE